MNSKSSQIDCNFVENVLFKSTKAELDENDKIEMLNHINSCEKCQFSEKILDYFQQSMTTELTNSKLIPNPAIVKSLKNKLNYPNERKNSFIDYVKSFFEFRVPVYQVVTALLIIGAFSFFLNNKSNSIESFNNNVSIIAVIDSNKISTSFKNSLELIDGYKKGKSIVEDSVLSSFIQSSM